MARSKRRSRTRDTHAIARHSRRFDPDQWSVGPTMRQVEDRRTWHPGSYTRPAARFDGALHRLVAPVQNPVYKPVSLPSTKIKFFQPLPSGVAFKDPQGVTICERRSRRRQVMFATRKSGKGGQRRPRYNEYSSVQCKRRK